jgi:hypothetical protein
MGPRILKLILEFHPGHEGILITKATSRCTEIMTSKDLLGAQVLTLKLMKRALLSQHNQALPDPLTRVEYRAQAEEPRATTEEEVEHNIGGFDHHSYNNY